MPSRQDRQAARLRGAGTAKIQNVGFKIQGGPSIRARTPARQTPGRQRGKTPQSTRRPQLEDLPSSAPRTTSRTPMPPPPLPPKSSAKNVARGGPASLRKSVPQTDEDPLSTPMAAPALKRGNTKPSRTSQVPLVKKPTTVPQVEPSPSPEASVPNKRNTKRKSVARDTRPSPAKKTRKSLPVPIPSRSPTPASDESEAEVSSPEPTPSPPRPTSKSRPSKSRATRDTDLEPGSIEVQVHKLATSAGGTRHINEIDGFLQVTTEVLNRATAQLLRHDPTQAKILDAFTEEVTIRLIEMTDAWDSHSVLVAAVKRAQKRKNILRRELLAIRKERADIQREMEAVRQSHELGEQEMRDLKIQQDFIADMEDLKARAPNPAEEEDQIKNGVEAALLELRPLVAGKSGIAERLASFNRFLEQFDNALTNA